MYLFINSNCLHNLKKKKNLIGPRIPSLFLKRIYFNPIAKCKGYHSSQAKLMNIYKVLHVFSP